MKGAHNVLACIAGIIGVVICSSLTASAQVATIQCVSEGVHALNLSPGGQFILTCQAPFDKPAPPNYHTHACPGTGANCEKPQTYASLFPNAPDHVWVQPQDNTSTPHTWTAPPAGMLSGKTVFSVGCTQSDLKKYCSVDVTVSSAMKRVVSGVVLAVCSVASFAAL